MYILSSKKDGFPEPHDSKLLFYAASLQMLTSPFHKTEAFTALVRLK